MAFCAAGPYCACMAFCTAGPYCAACAACTACTASAACAASAASEAKAACMGEAVAARRGPRARSVLLCGARSAYGHPRGRVHRRARPPESPSLPICHRRALCGKPHYASRGLLGLFRFVANPNAPRRRHYFDSGTAEIRFLSWSLKLSFVTSDMKF